MSVVSEPFAFSSTLLELRELSNRQELKEHFSLRYEAFSREGRYSSRPVVDQLDVDAYDLRSRFLGAWRVEPGGAREMVGGCRFIYRSQPSPLQAAVRSVLASCRDPYISTLPDPPTGLPVEHMFDLSGLGLNAHDWVEFSRTVCRGDCRGSNTSRSLVLGIFGLALATGVANGVGSAPPWLVDFYLKNGCVSFDVEPAWQEQRSNLAHLLLVPVAHLPSEVAGLVREMKRVFADGGAYRVPFTSALYRSRAEVMR